MKVDCGMIILKMRNEESLGSFIGGVEKILLEAGFDPSGPPSPFENTTTRIYESLNRDQVMCMYSENLLIDISEGANFKSDNGSIKRVEGNFGFLANGVILKTKVSEKGGLNLESAFKYCDYKVYLSELIDLSKMEKF